MLVVTGAEALYADMGHFGRRPIRRAWFWFVFPALTLNYLGQGALILESPRPIDNPFFLLMPEWARVPMVVLATMAAVIASQAVISGAFSVTRQAVQLGFLPRLKVHHTSEEEVGQVYTPAVNMLLFVAVVALVLGFGSSEKLAAAYGIAVTGTLAIDTILFFVVVRALWHKPLWMAAGGAAFFLTIDLAFFGANMPKIVHGGWFPLVIGVAVFTLLKTWQRGRELVDRRAPRGGRAATGVRRSPPRDGRPTLHRTPGTAVFLNAGRTPRRSRCGRTSSTTASLHSAAMILSIETLKVPHVDPSDRLTHDELGYRRRRDRPRDRPPRVPGLARRAGTGAPGEQGRRRVRDRRGELLLLRLPHHDRAHRRRGDGAVAQAAVRQPHATVVEPGRVLPPSG